MLEIRHYGDKVLRRKARSVRSIDDSIRRLAREMTELMHSSGGVGLAAPQVGKSVRLIVIDPTAGEHKEELFVLINPRIVASSGQYEDEEGCLCLPGLRLPVRRAMEVRVEGQDPDGNPVTRHARGLLARILQHEIDHLDGRLFVDRLPFFKRLAMKFRLLKLKRRYRRMRVNPD